MNLAKISYFRSHTRAFKRGGGFHTRFSIIATHTITELDILDRLYLPLIGGNNAFITVGTTDARRRLHSTRHTVTALNNGVRRSVFFRLPGSTNRHRVMGVGGAGRAPGACPEGTKAPGGGPLWAKGKATQPPISLRRNQIIFDKGSSLRLVFPRELCLSCVFLGFFIAVI